MPEILKSSALAPGREAGNSPVVDFARLWVADRDGGSRKFDQAPSSTIAGTFNQGRQAAHRAITAGMWVVVSVAFLAYLLLPFFGVA
jgi:hypothetical protein